MKPLTIEFHGVKLRAIQPKKRYWIGTLPTCPYQDVSVAGMDFPRYIDPPMVSPDGETVAREMRKGKIVSLVADQVAAIMAKLQTKVVRHAGARSFIRNTDDANFYQEPSDEPLAKYLYMVELGDETPSDAMTIGGNYPTPLWSEEHKK